jgi:hypothetical protein
LIGVSMPTSGGCSGWGVRVDLNPCHTHIIANVAIGPALVEVHVHLLGN